MGGLFSVFWGTKEGQCVLLALAVSQVTFIKNNQHATLAYWGAVCPNLHQEHGECLEYKLRE